MNGLPSLDVYWTAVGTKLLWLGIFTLVDFVFGVIVALMQKKFEWGKLTHYLTSDVIPIFVWMATELLALAPISVIPKEALGVIPLGVYGTVSLAILASIAGHFAELGVLKEQLAKVGVKPSKR